MKPHPRIRKTVKWAAAAVAVLLVVVLIQSVGSLVVWQSSSGVYVGFGHGGAVVGRCPIRDWSQTSGDAVELWFASSLSRTDRWWISIPTWFLVICSAAIATNAWRLDTLARRRAQMNLCTKCRYNRIGLGVNAKCPECGAAPVSV